MPRYRSWSDTDLTYFCAELDVLAIPYKVTKYTVDTGSVNVDQLASNHGLTKQKDDKR